MKIVQSFWSKPSLKFKNLNDFDRFNGGWLDKRYNFMSWTLSCLQLNKYYDRVELVTDAEGEALLIDKLQLPYSKVTVTLEDVNHYHNDLWAIGKLYTYSIQEEPFMHIDGDVFIWKKFEEDINNAPLIVQNLDADLPFYYPILNEVEENLAYIPEVVKEQRQKNRIVKSCNAGVFGGNDIPFLKKYCDKAFEFVNKNQEHLDKINVGYFNCIYEQYLFYCMIDHYEKEVQPVLNDLDKGVEGVKIDFNGIPSKVTYAHPANYAKKSETICNHIEHRLMMDYPEHYFHIVDLLEAHKI
jgi:hypothetical protein